MCPIEKVIMKVPIVFTGRPGITSSIRTRFSLDLTSSSGIASLTYLFPSLYKGQTHRACIPPLDYLGPGRAAIAIAAPTGRPVV